MDCFCGFASALTTIQETLGIYDSFINGSGIAAPALYVDGLLWRSGTFAAFCFHRYSGCIVSGGEWITVHIGEAAIMKIPKGQALAASVFFLAVTFAVAPLFAKRYIPTHDGEYHIIRIVEFARMIHAGYVFPRWAPTLNSGYGVPIFQYHYPLPNYVGAFVRVFTGDAVSAFQIAMGLGYISIAIASFYWLRSLFSITPAYIGATAGAFVPYVFVDMYVRGSIGELWAIAFLFWSLYCIEKKAYPFLAITYGLLILSHNILGMLFSPFLIAYCTLRDKRSLWQLLAGAGLSAYFWLPALLEQRFVVGLNTVNFREHFVQLYELLIPSWGSEFSGTGNTGSKISFQIGVAPLIAMIGSMLVIRRETDKKRRRLYILFFIVFIVAIFAMFSVSQGVWEVFRPLQLIQYPWRFLSFMIPIVSFSSAFWMSHIKKQWPGFLFVIIAVLFSVSYARPVTYEPRREVYYLARRNFTDGTSSMGNSFSTIWTGWKDTRPDAPILVKNGRIFQEISKRYLDKQFVVSMDKPGDVTVNIVYFPGWKATIDGRDTPILYKEDGVIHIAVPAGKHSIAVRYLDTGPRVAGDSISIISLGLIAAWGILHLYAHRN